MGEYLRRWRRKFGCLTLTLASLFAIGWIRSLNVRDRLQFRKDMQTLCFVESNLSRLTLIVYRERRELESRGIYWFGTTRAESLDWFSGPGKYVYSRTSWFGFEFGNFNMQSGHNCDVWTVPYWSIVVPFTAVSAGLLISNRRRATATERPTES